VFGIVKQHEGDITVVSAVGAGVSFLLTFPRATTLPSSAEPAPVERPPSAGRELILLVEDEAVVRRVASRALERSGYRVLVAEDGPSALAILEGLKEQPNLLLTDVIMPGMDGHTLALRVRERLPGIRVLYSSGLSEDVIAHRGVIDDGVDLLLKPYDPLTLTRTVRRILDR
jgi:CheY-like chemotaxis protein